MISLDKAKEISSPQICYSRATVGIGEYQIAVRPSVLSSVLGSCISVCLYDTVTKIGGMTHILLPNSLESRSRTFKSGKYADTAISAALTNMMKVGASKSNIVAKFVGGRITVDQEELSVGIKKAYAARRTLKSEGIRILAEDIGGKRGRYVEFYTDSGTVEVKMRIECEELIKHL